MQPNQADNLQSSCVHSFDETIPCGDIINNTSVEHGRFHINFSGLWPMGTDI